MADYGHEQSPARITKPTLRLGSCSFSVDLELIRCQKIDSSHDHGLDQMLAPTVRITIGWLRGPRQG